MIDSGERTAPLSVVTSFSGAGFLRRTRSLVRKKPLAAASAMIVLLLIILAAFAPWIAPHHYSDIDPVHSLLGPSSHHWFGTDDKGRDQLSRVIWGARTTVVIGFGATAMAVAIASVIGITCGFFGGWYDTIVQRIIEVWQAFPGIIFVIFVISIFGSSTLHVAITLGLLFSAGTSRVIRGTTIGVRGQPFIEATRSIGAGHLRILVFHVLPNVIPVIIVAASVQIGAVVLAESSLSFIGFGVPAPFPSWGRLLQESQRFMRSYPYLAIFPGGAIALVVFSFNMLGDGIRDLLDPRLRGQ